MSEDHDRTLAQPGGPAYKHGLIIAVIGIFIDAVCADNGIKLAEGMWGHVLLIVVICAAVYGESLIRGYLDLKERSVSRLCIFFGVTGVILLVWSIIDIITGGYIRGDFLVPKKAAETLMALCWLSIGLIYWRKKRMLS